MDDIAICVSLCALLINREHLTCNRQLINVMSNEKYLDNFGTPKHFGQFLEDVFDKRWTLDWAEFENCSTLTPVVYRVGAH